MPMSAWVLSLGLTPVSPSIGAKPMLASSCSTRSLLISYLITTSARAWAVASTTIWVTCSRSSMTRAWTRVASFEAALWLAL